LPDSLEDFGSELASGTLMLKKEILVDPKEISKDPFDSATGEEENQKWRDLFQEIENELG
jgi:hypothetical protein